MKKYLKIINNAEQVRLQEHSESYKRKEISTEPTKFKGKNSEHPGEEISEAEFFAVPYYSILHAKVFERDLPEFLH